MDVEGGVTVGGGGGGMQDGDAQTQLAFPLLHMFLLPLPHWITPLAL